MAMPIVTTRPGIFNFLGLPPELRNRIYQLNLSEKGIVDYEDTSGDICVSYDKPRYKLNLGINVLRVCRQIYDEAVSFAYADRL